MTDTALLALDLAAAGLEAGTLRPQRARLREALGQPFEFELLALAAPDATPDLDALLGKPMTVQLALGDDSVRPFHGLVAEAGLRGPVGDRVAWRLVLRPWLWLLTRRRDSRIFQAQALQDLLSTVFGAYSAAAFDFSGASSNPTLDFCAQYRESDFDFVSRLLEREGLYYYFEHSDSAHTMKIVDQMSAHTALSGHESVVYRAGDGPAADLDYVSAWHTRREIQSGQVVVNDFDFTQPATSLLSTASSTLSNAVTTLEDYDYPAAFATAAAGQQVATLRLQAHEARYCRIDGEGRLRALACGRRFTLAEHPVAAECAEHVVLATELTVALPPPESGGEAAELHCRFEALRAADVFRPQRTTAWPRISGPQPALVVGPEGDEIHTDAHGRVKLRFPWDRNGASDDTASCWVRVAQAAAGNGFGWLALPRVGQEVVVEFVDGDPDRPLVTGRVFNGANPLPFTLPDHKTVSTLRSHSVGGDGYNELRFEDQSGAELVLLHAQKDFTQLVKHDAATLIEHDELRVVKNNANEEIQVDAQRKIGGTLKHEVVGDASYKVGGKSATAVTGNLSMKTDADWCVSAGGAASIAAGGKANVAAADNLGLGSDANIHIKAGSNVVIEAGAEITLKASAIVLDASGIITIKGSMVNINSGGAGGAGSGVSTGSPDAPEAPEAPTEPTDPLAA